jgi:hypothetical protein
VYALEEAEAIKPATELYVGEDRHKILEKTRPKPDTSIAMLRRVLVCSGAATIFLISVAYSERPDSVER